MKEIYLDNSATTRVCPEAVDEMIRVMTVEYGNPSSLHEKGVGAEHAVESAREAIAELLKAGREEIYFTSGGTESNNTAVFGAARALKRRGNRIVTTSVEHSSVLEAMDQLEKNGFEIIRLDPDKSGSVPVEALGQAINKDTILVSMMAVNNETGAPQPIEQVSRLIALARAPALFHVDAVQAFGKQPVYPARLGIDLLSASSHKIHGPKGAGILYVRRGARILPLHYGGEQQKKLRPGTEPVPAICGMGAAVRALPDMNEERERISVLNNALRKELSSVSGVVIHSPENALPYILNFSVMGIRSETMLHYLEQSGIYVSSGSACAKGRKSHVLRAMGLSQGEADSALRVSFSRYNTPEDITALVSELRNADNTLARSAQK